MTSSLQVSAPTGVSATDQRQQMIALLTAIHAALQAGSGLTISVSSRDVHDAVDVGLDLADKMWAH